MLAQSGENSEKQRKAAKNSEKQRKATISAGLLEGTNGRSCDL